MSSLKDMPFTVVEALTFACCIYREKGYTSTSSYTAGDQQSYTNKDMLTFELMPQLAGSAYLLKFTPTVEDIDQALAIVKHFRKLSFGIIGDTLNDYMGRVFAVTQNENITMKDFGVLASVPQVYDREINDKQVKAAIKDTVKAYLGQEGDTIVLNIRYIQSKPVPQIGCFSHTAITDGNYLVGFLSKELLGIAGSSQQIRAKVKKHSVNFTSKTPETQLNYVKVLDREFVWL
jgi:hypothetical protein